MLTFCLGILFVILAFSLWIVIAAWYDIDHTPKPLNQGPHISD